MRKKIVAGNWKMNTLPAEAEMLFNEVNEMSKIGVEVMIFPPAIYLSQFTARAKNLIVGAQNFYPAESGAFTGELSVSQLKSIGVKALLIGHSERRAFFGEHESFLKEKVDACLEHGLTAVFCCGEPLSVREKGEEYSFVHKQLVDSLFHLSEDQMKNVVIAYEPVWAIGTGMTATSQQAEDMHRAIRTWVSEAYSLATADATTILYGGSCNEKNASELFECPNVDGGLIGGASLKADSFREIIKAR